MVVVEVGVVAIWWWLTWGGEDRECEMKDLEKFLRVHVCICLCI